jgi:DNA mismatch repair ATPase MutS
VFFFVTDFCYVGCQVAQAAGLPDELVSKAKQSRSEKKARKAMSKLGMFLSTSAEFKMKLELTGKYYDGKRCDCNR